ncbi:hypothetical protein Y032_0034g2851 [Ancylostoma ceylanicum]|uniref:Uncharacterized protein n=1 Tax=Ancylostoma ceylanicum TaxID=53326 RepID=A0A016UMP4_9BILA|nr:hypothetical protein Y032_0034g2851 [Ancylostoma ceylanicum]
MSRLVLSKLCGSKYKQREGEERIIYSQAPHQSVNDPTMNDVGPARLIGIYGGTCFLVYLETNGFTKANVVVDHVWLAAAGAVLPITDVPYATEGKVFNSWLVRRHGPLIDEWSIALAMFGTMFYCTLAYHCFAEIFVSIPFLVLLHAGAFATSCFLVVAAGSACQYSLEPDYETMQVNLLLLYAHCDPKVGVDGFGLSAASKSTRRNRAAYHGVAAAVANLGFLDGYSSHLMLTNKKTNYLSRITLSL